MAEVTQEQWPITKSLASPRAKFGDLVVSCDVGSPAGPPQRLRRLSVTVAAEELRTELRALLDAYEGRGRELEDLKAKMDRCDLADFHLERKLKARVAEQARLASEYAAKADHIDALWCEEHRKVLEQAREIERLKRGCFETKDEFGTRVMRLRAEAAEAALQAEQDTHARTIADLNGMTAERDSLREQLQAAQADANHGWDEVLVLKRQLASEAEKRKKLREAIKILKSSAIGYDQGRADALLAEVDDHG